MDLLNWAAAIAPGVVLCKDGGLLTGYYYEGPDLSVETNLNRNLVSERITSAFLRFDSSWSIHIDATRVRSRPPEGEDAFPDDVTRMMDRSRRKRHVAFESIHSIVLKWIPPGTRSRRGMKSLTSNGGTGGEDDLEGVLEEFKTQLAEFEDSLAGTLLLDRLERDEQDVDGRTRVCDRLVSHLRWMLSGEPYPLELPLCPAYLDGVLGADELYAGTIPQLGSRFIQVVGIDGFPQSTYPGILSALDYLPIEYRWSTRYLFRDRLESQRDLKLMRNKWSDQTRSFVDRVFNKHPGTGGSVNRDAMAMVEETEEAMDSAASGLVNYGFYTGVIVLMSENRSELQELTRQVRKIVLGLGFGARIEGLNATEAWLGTLPGHTRENVRRPVIDTSHLSNLLPLSSSWTGSALCPSPMIEHGNAPALIRAHTEDSTPFNFNLHVDDVGHTLLFGPTGSGKSTLLALICAQFRRYANASVHIFDKGRSLETLTHAVGGNHFIVADADDPQHLCFAPLARIDDATELDWACSWVESLLLLNSIPAGPDQRRELRRAMRELAATPTKRTISALRIKVQDRELTTGLEPYTVDGPYGRILDGEEDGLTDSSWSCFELASLLELDDPRLSLPVLLYLFRHIERQARGNPMLICLDEAWTMLSHEVFRNKIREWLKTLRKSNVAVLMATQSISDAAESGILDVLVESCFTRIFGSNAEALTVSAEGYRRLGLIDSEFGVIADLQPKREYYVVQRDLGRRVVNFNIGPEELVFCGVSSGSDLNEVRRLRLEHPSDWEKRWMDQRLEVNP